MLNKVLGRLTINYEFGLKDRKILIYQGEKSVESFWAFFGKDFLFKFRKNTLLSKIVPKIECPLKQESAIYHSINLGFDAVLLKISYMVSNV